jgi:hypothetical protein
VVDATKIPVSCTFVVMVAPPPPPNACVSDPLKVAVTKWPTSQSRAASGTWNPNGRTLVSAEFFWSPQRFIATDARGCTVTVTR